MPLEVLLFALLQGALPRHQVAVLPTGALEVAYRQEQDGKVDERVFLAKLECAAGDCELTSVDLGWCLPLGPGGERASFIFTDRKSTADRSLKVSPRLENNRGVLVVEEETQGAKITYRFEFSLRNEQFGGEPSIDRLTGFSGAAVKNSTLEKKVIAWKLVPFVGEQSLFSPQCKFLLPGVPAK